jgi:hypothetical protein
MKKRTKKKVAAAKKTLPLAGTIQPKVSDTKAQASEPPGLLIEGPDGKLSVRPFPLGGDSFLHPFESVTLFLTLF